jgi:SET domain
MSNRDTFFEPCSEFFVIKDTKYAGRGVFATRAIQKDSFLLRSDFIALAVLSREYRREVCAFCYQYERGRNLKSRIQNVNFAFCSLECENNWKEQSSSLSIKAWESTEDFIKSRLSKSQPSGFDSSEHCDLNANSMRHPNVEEINEVWESVESTAHFIREARAGSQAKPHQRALKSAKTLIPVSDILYWLLTGIIAHYSYSNVDGNDASAHSWKALMALTADQSPYQSSFQLRQHAFSYLQLLAILPEGLLPSVTAQVCREMVARDVHNSFGIRSLEDEGAEFFGWGVWPEASYFNHSCSPNVAKCRAGRQWQFWASRDIIAGEQLFISYLGGDEKDMSYDERKQRLNETWGFDCLCPRCAHDRKLEHSGEPESNGSTNTTEINGLAENMRTISINQI